MRMEGAEDESAHRFRQFGELIAACHRDLFSFIYALVQHHADAEDVYQQVTIVLWEKFDRFELGTNFAAWATKVAHLTALDFMKSRRRRAVVFNDQVLDAIAASYDSKKSWASVEATEALQSCLGKLSQRDRHLIDRCYAEDRDFASVAVEENRTIGAIYQAICRIRKNLYHCVRRTLSQENY